MTSIDVVSKTQTIQVDHVTQLLSVKEQRLIVDPVTNELVVVPAGQTIVVGNPTPSINVVGSGPIGPAGISSTPENPSQAAFHLAATLPKKTITYSDGLPDVIEYLDDDDVVIYSAQFTYSSRLPVLVALERLSDNQVFEKTITYSTGLPISVEWTSA